MRWQVFLTVSLLLTCQGGLSAEESAKAVIDKAVAAAGGPARLTKFKAVVARLKGTLLGQGDPIPFTGEIKTQGPEQMRFQLEGEFDGQKISYVNVLNRDQAWHKINDEVAELGKDEVEETRENAWSEWVSTLAPLQQPGFTFTLLDEVMVHGRPAVGVRVSSKGHRDVSLYFDKETFRHVRTDSRVKDERTLQEVTEVATFSNFKEIDGLPVAMKIAVEREGKPYLDAVYTEIKFVDKLADAEFDKP